jgi:aminocarboxymuconate-semialdehyde decarboxylase
VVRHGRPRTRGALRGACDTVGADRLLLGTDFPYEFGHLFQRAVDYIAQPRLADQNAKSILDTTALNVLRLDPA